MGSRPLPAWDSGWARFRAASLGAFVPKLTALRPEFRDVSRRTVRGGRPVLPVVPSTGPEGVAMKKLVKWSSVLVLVALILFGMSYVGARARAGLFLGSPLPSLGHRSVRFAFEGAEEVPGNPRAWVVAYGPTAIPGARDIRLYVSPTGKVISTYPIDLRARLEPFKRVAP